MDHSSIDENIISPNNETIEISMNDIIMEEQFEENNSVQTKGNKNQKKETKCCNPTLAKCGGEAQHLEKLRIWSPLGLPNF
jgi:hypothetical protein